jgi:hypothetical protein
MIIHTFGGWSRTYPLATKSPSAFWKPGNVTNHLTSAIAMFDFPGG